MSRIPSQPVKAHHDAIDNCFDALWSDLMMEEKDTKLYREKRKQFRATCIELTKELKEEDKKAQLKKKKADEDEDGEQAEPKRRVRIEAAKPSKSKKKSSTSKGKSRK